MATTYDGARTAEISANVLAARVKLRSSHPSRATKLASPSPACSSAEETTRYPAQQLRRCSKHLKPPFVVVTHFSLGDVFRRPRESLLRGRGALILQCLTSLLSLCALHTEVEIPRVAARLASLHLALCRRLALTRPSVARRNADGAPSRRTTSRTMPSPTDSNCRSAR